MLSQITFANKSSLRDDKDEDSRKTSKHKSTKNRKTKKESKTADRCDADRRSSSPVVHEASPAHARSEQVQQPKSSAHASDTAAGEPDQMDNFLQDISAAVPVKSKEGPEHQHEPTKAVARRLQGVQGKSSGRVGDGGSNWRKRMQRRATERATDRGEKLPKDQGRLGPDVPPAARRWSSAGNDFSEANANMRRPSQDIVSAFGQSRPSESRKLQSKQLCTSVHALSTTEAANVRPRHNGDSSQYGIEGASQDIAAGHGNSEPSPPVANAGAAVGANMSVAAQLRARLRGEPMPPTSVDKSVTERLQRHRDSRLPPEKRRGSQQVQRFRDGERQQYFEDDDMHSTAALAKNARLGLDLHDMDEAMARNITSKRKFRAQELDVDDEYDHDGGLDLSERKKGKPGRSGTNSRQIPRPHTDLIQSQCRRCFMGATRNRDLTVSVGMHVYMAMPERGSLAPGHVTLLPVEHTSSFREADDDTYEELKNFQKCLIKMFAAEGLSCIFFETALKTKEARTHACIDCVPVDSDAFAAAPMMFRKEIGESESEWSQHHSKSIIDTSEKGLRRCVPIKFPYFHVQYGYRRGSVHVIDDEQRWERGFGRSILVSLTGGKEVEMYRRAQRRDADTGKSQKTTFIKQWSQFDWTQQLE